MRGRWIVALFFGFVLGMENTEAQRTPGTLDNVLASDSELKNLKELIAFRAREDLEGAKVSLNRLISINPEEHLYKHMLGALILDQTESLPPGQVRNQKEGEALALIREVLQKKKRFRPAYDVLIRYYTERGLEHEAREVLEETVQVFGSQARSAFADLCRNYARGGFISQAIKTCEAATVRGAKLPESYVYLAQALSDEGNSARAEKTVRMLAKQFPKSSFAQFAAGNYFVLRKNFDEAQKYFFASTKANPEQAAAQLGLAESLFEIGRFEDALEPFRKACELDRSLQEPFLRATGRLRLKGQAMLAEKYSSLSNSCLKIR